MSLSFNKNKLIDNEKSIKIAGSQVINNNGLGGVKSLEEIRREMSNANLREPLKEEHVKVEVVDKQLSHRDKISAIKNILKK